MKIGNFTYLFKEGARNVLHNKLMSFASIGVLVACLLLIGSAALFSLNINSMVRYVEQQNEVVAYVAEGMSQQDLEVLDLTLREMDNIVEQTFYTKDEMLAQKKEQLGEEYNGLLDGLDGDNNPMADTYVLRIRDPELMEFTVKMIESTDGIEKVTAATDVALTLVGIRNAVNTAGSAIVIILVVVSVVIITNTIKITVFSRRKEINIMKYVGATDTFIRLPFLVEGTLIGLLAATIAFVMLGFGYTYLFEWMGETYATQFASFFNNSIEFWDIAHRIFAAFAALGIFIGMMGSGVFVRKYLKV